MATFSTEEWIHNGKPSFWKTQGTTKNHSGYVSFMVEIIMIHQHDNSECIDVLDELEATKHFIRELDNLISEDFEASKSKRAVSELDDIWGSFSDCMHRDCENVYDDIDSDICILEVSERMMRDEIDAFEKKFNSGNDDDMAFDTLFRSISVPLDNLQQYKETGGDKEERDDDGIKSHFMRRNGRNANPSRRKEPSSSNSLEIVREKSQNEMQKVGMAKKSEHKDISRHSELMGLEYSDECSGCGQVDRISRSAINETLERKIHDDMPSFGRYLQTAIQYTYSASNDETEDNQEAVMDTSSRDKSVTLIEKNPNYSNEGLCYIDRSLKKIAGGIDDEEEEEGYLYFHSLVRGQSAEISTDIPGMEQTDDEIQGVAFDYEMNFAESIENDPFLNTSEENNKQASDVTSEKAPNTECSIDARNFYKNVDVEIRTLSGDTNHFSCSASFMEKNLLNYIDANPTISLLQSNVDEIAEKVYRQKNSEDESGEESILVTMACSMKDGIDYSSSIMESYVLMIAENAMEYFEEHD